jgi:hypothetical protein
MPPNTERIGDVIWITEDQVAVEIILGDYSKIEIREIVEDEGKLNSARLIKKLNWVRNYMTIFLKMTNLD